MRTNKYWELQRRSKSKKSYKGSFFLEKEDIDRDNFVGDNISGKIRNAPSKCSRVILQTTQVSCTQTFEDFCQTVRKKSAIEQQLLNATSLICDGVVLEIYLDHKFQWPQEGLNCESLAYQVVT